jgi:peptide/nickel transport system substrate-binding protein
VPDGAICPALAQRGRLLHHRGSNVERIMRRVAAFFLVFPLLAGAAFAATLPGAAFAATLRIGLNEDPDALDPARGGSFVGRVVFAAVCDKLIDTDGQNNFVPQLAASWSWSADNLALTVALRDGVTFHDGQAMDADAVKANLERYRSAPESLRKGELKPVGSVTVVDPHTVRLHLAQPYAPLVAVLADRAGMMISPRMISPGIISPGIISPGALGRDVTPDLPCAGPFRLTERVAQDRIVVERFPGYWNADAVRLDRIVYQPIPDTTVRLVNLQAGQLDMVERLGPTDVAAVKQNPRLRLISQTALAYYTLGINLAADTPLKDPRVREALEAAIDRTVINDVVMDGQFIPSNQFEAPGSRYWNSDHPLPPHDPGRARALLQQAGMERPSFSLTVGNSPVEQQVGQVIQSLAGEAGFDIRLRAMEANALVAAGKAGDYHAMVVIWSGRPDPDGNVAIWLACDGFLNWGRYCNPTFDDLLARARGVTDVVQRQALYRQLVDVYLADRPHIVLYHAKWLWALSDKVSGFVPTPDGMIRPQGMVIAP